LQILVSAIELFGSRILNSLSWIRPDNLVRSFSTSLQPYFLCKAFFIKL
jgi:hypothetical protein